MSDKSYFKTNYHYYVDGYLEQLMNKLYKYSDPLITKPILYLNTIKAFISQCNNKNLIILRTNNNTNYTITFLDRKIIVTGLVFSSVMFHYLSERNRGFRYRLFIPYFIIYSILFYREALNPYNLYTM